MVTAAIEAPLTARVLDPARGSGTFLFHALRRLIAAIRAALAADGIADEIETLVAALLPN